MHSLLLAAIVPFFSLLPAHAETPDGEMFVAAFAEVCIPERLSYRGTTSLAEKLGWRSLVAGDNPEYDRFITHTDAMLAEEIAEDPDFLEGSGYAWFTRDIGGRSHLLAVSYLLSEYLDTVGCYLYDFSATAPINPEPVTLLLGQQVAYTTDGDDPMYAADPALLVSTVWGPSPRLPRTLDTYLTFIPEGSEVAAQTGFTGLMLKFSTSLPDRAAEIMNSDTRRQVARAADEGFATGGRQGMLAAMFDAQRKLHAKGEEQSFRLALTASHMGDSGMAVDYLQEAIERQEPGVLGIRLELARAVMDAVPRYQDLVKQVGFSTD